MIQAVNENTGFNFNDIKIEHDQDTLLIKDRLNELLDRLLTMSPIVHFSKEDSEFLKILNNENIHYTYKIKDKDNLKSFIRMCIRLKIYNLNWIDVSDIKDMSCILSFIPEKIFLKIDKWDVSNVKDMDSMFEHSMIQADLSNWDVSNVKSMRWMFLDSYIDSDISDWDVHNVKTMVCMFQQSRFTGDISRWDVSNVENMTAMFADTIWNGDISNWDTSKCESMSHMFNYALNFNCDISKWNVSKVTEMEFMFCNAKKFDQDISRWDVSHVVKFQGMFAFSVFNHDISKWNFNKNIVSFRQMFKDSAYSYPLDMLGVYKNDEHPYAYLLIR